MATSRGLDWRALLSQPAAASAVVRRSPFTPKQQSADTDAQAQQTGHDSSSSRTAARGDAEQQQQPAASEQQPAYVVPILLSKAAVQQIPEAKLAHCQEPQQHLAKLQELQQLTSSMLAAAAELATQGERQEQQEQQQQQPSEAPDIGDPYLRRPVPPPQHAQHDSCYFWSGSWTSPCSEAAAAAGAAAAAHGQQRASDGGCSSRGDGVDVVGASMETSVTTRVRPSSSEGGSAMFSTARSPAQSWGSALSRLKQLQLKTLEALEVQ